MYQSLCCSARNKGHKDTEIGAIVQKSAIAVAISFCVGGTCYTVSVKHEMLKEGGFIEDRGSCLVKPIGTKLQP